MCHRRRHCQFVSGALQSVVRGQWGGAPEQPPEETFPHNSGRRVARAGALGPLVRSDMLLAPAKAILCVCPCAHRLVLDSTVFDSVVGFGRMPPAKEARSGCPALPWAARQPRRICAST